MKNIVLQYLNHLAMINHQLIFKVYAIDNINLSAQIVC